MIFSLVIYVTITFMLNKLEFDLKLKPEYLILQIIYFQLSAELEIIEFDNLWVKESMDCVG